MAMENEYATARPKNPKRKSSALFSRDAIKKNIAAHTIFAILVSQSVSKRWKSLQIRMWCNVLSYCKYTYTPTGQ